MADLNEAIAIYSGHLRMSIQHRETVADQGVEAVLLAVGESHLELLRPLSPDTAVGRFLERSGPGRLESLVDVLGAVGEVVEPRAAGLRLIDEQPRTGIGNSRVAFVHPGSTGGVLTELVEAAR